MSRHRKSRASGAGLLTAAVAAAALAFAAPANAAPAQPAPTTQGDQATQQSTDQAPQPDKKQDKKQDQSADQGQPAMTGPVPPKADAPSTQESPAPNAPAPAVGGQAGMTGPAAPTSKSAPTAPLPVPGNPTESAPTNGAAVSTTPATTVPAGTADAEPAGQSTPAATTPAATAPADSSPSVQPAPAPQAEPVAQSAPAEQVAPQRSEPNAPAAAPAPVAPVVTMVPPHAEGQVNVDATRSALPGSANTRVYADAAGAVATAGFTSGAHRGTTGLSVEHTGPTSVRLTAFVGDENATDARTASTDVDYTPVADATAAANAWVQAQPGGATALDAARSAGALIAPAPAHAGPVRPLDIDLAGVQVHAGGELKH